MALTKTPSELTAADLTITTAAQPNITSLGTLTTLTIDDITINGSTISDGGDLTIDVAGDINFDADGGDVNFKDGGTLYGFMSKSTNDLYVGNAISDGDVLIRGNDGGSNITALSFDMSDAGAATFNSTVTATKLVSTNGVIELDDNGSHNGVINSPASLYINIDSDANSSGEVLEVGKDRTATSGGTSLFKVIETGNVEIPDGNLVFASGHGIDFNATANSSGSLGGELFDDYEEGTWTPVMISGGSTNPTGGGAISPSGRYTKIGHRVFVTFYVGRSWTNSPSGGIQISGLPYTINASTNGYYTGSCATYNITFGASGSPFLIPTSGNTTFALYSANSGGTWTEMTWQTHAASTAGIYVTGMFSYHV